jgi:serine/alanine adding enzyme
MEFLRNEEVNRKEWQLFIERNLFLSPFQTPAFYDFFNSVQGQKAQVYALCENSSFCALTVVTLQKESNIKGFFSRRAIVYGGAIVSENRIEYFVKLLNFLQAELKKDFIYIEIRNNHDYNAFQVNLPDRWIYIPYFNYRLNLSCKTMDELLKAMNYNRRREIALSFKEGVSYQIAANLQEVASLYGILKELYETRVKLPLPNLEYFEKLYHSEIGKVFVVKHESKLIGGAFCFYYPNSSINTLYYCGLRNYRSKIFPTHIAIYATIDFGLKNNLKLLDMMGAGKPDEKYGVRKYKSEFGGDLTEFGRFHLITKPFLYFIGRMGIKILHKLR